MLLLLSRMVNALRGSEAAVVEVGAKHGRFNQGSLNGAALMHPGRSNSNTSQRPPPSVNGRQRHAAITVGRQLQGCMSTGRLGYRVGELEVRLESTGHGGGGDQPGFVDVPRQHI